MDVFTAVQARVAEAGNIQCMDCVIGTVVPDLSNGKYAFALVHCPAAGSQGLFVYRYQTPVKNPGDLALASVIAITSEFQYALGTPAFDQAILQVKITCPDTSLVIEVPFEPGSSNFFMKIKKCANVCVERMKKNIMPQFQWLEKYKAQVVTALGTSQDPIGPPTFYTPTPDLNPSPTQNQDPFGDLLTDPFANLASSRQPNRTSDNVNTVDRNAKLSPSHSAPVLHSSSSTNSLPATSKQNSYINCPKDPGFLVDLEGNILTLPAVVHPAPPKSDVSAADPWGQSNNLSDINRISSSSSSSSESKTQSSLLGFEDDFTDIVKTSTLQPTGTLYENASTASITTSSSTGSFDLYSEQSTKSSTLMPDDEVDVGGYATIKPIFKPAGIRPEILKRREAEYTFPHDFRVFVGTWNVNGQTASEDLGPWLNVDERKADIYAIGFQELDLSKEAFLFNDSAREEEWNKAIEKTLHRVGVYIKVKLIRLVGMMLLVYAKERHAPFIHDVIADTVGTGIMGKMGNKGGVAVRFEFHNTSFCFVNSHLAAHMEEYERRNQDYNDICSRMKFELSTQRQLTITRGHEVVIWMGDLNYRISDLSVDVVKVHIDKNDFQTLMEHDQLFRQHRIEKVFKGFKEGDITFKPTYKYDPGTDNWDTSEKQRVPAWCDRILYKGPTIKQLVYRSHDKCKLSDHKPVSSLFDIGVKVIDEKKFKQVVEEEIRNLDRQENEALPQVALTLNNLEFKDVYYMEPQSLTLDVANVGQVNTVAKFVNKLDDKHFCKPWLKVEPSEVFMMPADTVEFSITVQVDKNSAAALNSGEDSLDDILVFHLDNGKDYYITVSGNYIPSSFGASIEALVQMHGPIREMSPAEIKKLESGASTDEAKGSEVAFERFDIPKEIWMLVDHLFRNATKTENLFSEEGLHKDVLAIRDCLDVGFPEEMPDNLHSVAEALLMFLESLREPVIPYKYYNKCLECANNFTLCKQVLTQIPRSHRNVFKYLAAFIRELLMNSDENKLDTKTLATVFGEIFLRPPASEREASLGRTRAQMQQISRKKATFVYQFIINEYDE